MSIEIKLSTLNKSEALRYLGYGENIPDEKINQLMIESEEELFKTAKPRYVYKVFDIEEKDKGVELIGTNLTLYGNSIKEHLNGCEKCVVMAVTISAEVDKLLRITQVKDMAKALVLDSLSSVAIEQICDKLERVIKKEFGQYNQTWRFGVGYGDLPLSLQSEVLSILNAPKQIGLCTTDSDMLTPTKSVTAIIGLSTGEIAETKRGCQTCNLKDKCAFRKKGGRCNV